MIWFRKLAILLKRIRRSMTRLGRVSLLKSCSALILIALLLWIFNLSNMGTVQEVVKDLNQEFEDFQECRWKNMLLLHDSNLTTQHSPALYALGNGRLIGFATRDDFRLHQIKMPATPDGTHPAYVEDKPILNFKLDSLLNGYYAMPASLIYLNREEGCIYAHRSISTENGEKIKQSTRIFVHRLKNILVRETNITNLEETDISLEIQSAQSVFNLDKQEKHSRVICTVAGKHKLCTHSSWKNLKINIKSKRTEIFTTVAEFPDMGNKTEKFDDINVLFSAHKEAWSKDCQSLVTVGRSLAPGALNQDSINTTLFLLASMTEHVGGKLPDSFTGCYSHYSTMEAASLWKVPRSPSEFNNLFRLWSVTMVKHGCKKIFYSGIAGLKTSLMLSVGSFMYLKQHVQFNIDKDLLVRNIIFRSLYLPNGCTVDVECSISEDNRPEIMVHSNCFTNVYVCDAGCDMIHDLKGNGSTKVTVKRTTPDSALLYISPSREHLEGLREALHIRHVALVNPHSRQLMALHRHGHRYGGLPMIFWITLVSLVIIFHGVIIHFVYTELLPDWKKH